MLVYEEYVNETENYGCGDSGFYEPFTQDTGELFKALQREYGRCTSKVYIDTENGSKAIGWVFQKAAEYEDTRERYLRSVWVTLHESEPEKTVKYNYKEIN